MSSRRIRCIALVAPTASGKTELSLMLAERYGFEIVSMDSAMVYRGMDIGTAKPSPATRADVPHHLIDIVEPSERYSAGRFVTDASHAIEDIDRRGRPALIVGGTMLYLKALREGLAELPEADADVREQIDEQAAAEGWPAMHARLARVDPQAAARIAPTDRQRIQRALEVHELTGQALSKLRGQAAPVTALDVHTIALIPDDREALAGRIERRFDAMLDAGLIDEVAQLRARGDLDPGLPSMRSVGYRQVWSCLEGQCSLAQARERGIVATRQLAKRQLTWLRSITAGHTIRAIGRSAEVSLLTAVDAALEAVR